MPCVGLGNWKCDGIQAQMVAAVIDFLVIYIMKYLNSFAPIVMW